MKNKKYTYVFIASILLLAFSFIAALLVGRYSVKPSAIFGILTGSGDYTVEKSIISKLRLPRTISAGLVGAALSVSGLLYQETFQNKLVSPDLLGVSSGAGVGAALSILLGFPTWIISFSAFGFGILTVLLTLVLAKAFGNHTLILTLSGIIVGGLMSSVLSVIKYAADAETTLSSITFWLMGTFENSVISNLKVLAPIVGFCLLAVYLIRGRVEVIALGEEEARSRGINYRKYRYVIIGIATLLTATSVAFVGTISWMGLVIPHIVRLCIGRSNKMTIPLSIVFGAFFMIISDVICRTFTAAEIPISAITGSLGTLAFIGIMIYNKLKKGERLYENT